jgi:hypothetical protein
MSPKVCLPNGRSVDDWSRQDEVRAKIAGLRQHVRASFGTVAMSIMVLRPHYRHQTLDVRQYSLKAATCP